MHAIACLNKQKTCLGPLLEQSCCSVEVAAMRRCGASDLWQLQTHAAQTKLTSLQMNERSQLRCLWDIVIMRYPAEYAFANTFQHAADA